MIPRSLLVAIVLALASVVLGLGAAQPADFFVFQSYEGDRGKPESMEFQLNPRGLAGRARHTVFLKLGDSVPGTDFILKDFSYKTARDPKTSEEQDVSELRLQNAKTNESLTLPLAGWRKDTISAEDLQALKTAAAIYTDAEAAAHVGESATVRGKVVAAGTSKQGNIYLNFGNVHPKQTFSAAIMAKDAGKFGDPQRFEGTTVAVTGTIILYNDKPEIIVAEPGELRILDDSGAAPVPSKP